MDLAPPSRTSTTASWVDATPGSEAADADSIANPTDHGGNGDSNTTSVPATEGLNLQVQVQENKCDTASGQQKPSEEEDFKCQTKVFYNHAGSHGVYPRWSEFPDPLEDERRLKEVGKAFAIIQRQSKFGGVGGGGGSDVDVWRTASIEAQSPRLRCVLDTIFHDYPSWNTGTNTPYQVASPFQPFVHRWSAFNLEIDRQNGLGPDHEKTVNELQLLRNEVQPLVEGNLSVLDKTKKDGTIAFGDLWLILNPGCLVMVHDDERGGRGGGPLDRSSCGVLQLLEATHIPHMIGIRKAPPARYELTLVAVDWDGNQCGVSARTKTIEDWGGQPMSINKLDAYPIEFADPSGWKEMERRLIARGRKFEALRGFHVKSIRDDGRKYVAKGSTIKERPCSGRVIVDAYAYFKVQNTIPSKSIPLSEYRRNPALLLPTRGPPPGVHPGWLTDPRMPRAPLLPPPPPPGFGRAKPSRKKGRHHDSSDSDNSTTTSSGLSEESSSASEGVTDEPGSDSGSEREGSTATSSSSSSSSALARRRAKKKNRARRRAEKSYGSLMEGSIGQRNEDLSPLTDLECIIATPWAKGFDLGAKEWCEFSVDDLQDSVWDDAPYDNLVLPKGERDLVFAFANRPQLGKQGFDDFVGHKGEGIIILLCGPPGVGKTLTAEAVAEKSRSPLYILGASDLGTSPEKVERGLMKALQCCQLWNAVLLVDEADVFLASRQDSSSANLQRNELVSIFLRRLEYYRGLMFLTTNRITAIDSAFKSRIDLILPYFDLDETARRKVWVNFVRKLDAGVAEISEEDFDELAKTPLNGREIKNSIKTALVLANAGGKDKGAGPSGGTDRKSVCEPLTLKHLKVVLGIRKRLEKLEIA